MNEETEIWGGEPVNDINWENIKCEVVQPTIDLKYFLNKYQLTLNGVNVNIDLDKLIMLGIIKPE